MTTSTDPARIQCAEISQPLTTAFQTALVDLLRASGITFNAVVGHSSGEIAAAYAAGYFTVKDAIRVAYHRGPYSHLSKAANGQSGKMMAVGMTLAEAKRLCAREKFLGRVKVTASNSQSSITLSGDTDAIDEAKAFLDAEKTFARVLAINKAYHSHHLEPSSRAYLESLRQCDIEPRRTNVESDCNCYPSVHVLNGRSMFSQALSRAAQEENCFDIVLEVGPYPVLKGPATETLKKNIQSPIPVVDFDSFQTACNGCTSRKPQVQKGSLHTVGTDDRPLFKGSRRSKIWRTQSRPVDELLGKLTPMNGEEVRWHNIIKLSEMEWLQRHQFQGGFPELPMTDIGLDRFYMWLMTCGLDYSGDFLVDSMKRGLNVSTVAIRRKAHKQYRPYPATLDAAFQGFYSAFAFPGDGRLRSIYLPTSIRKVRINMATCPRIVACEESGLVIDCHLTGTTARTTHGDLDMFCAEDNHPEMQAQGVVYSSFENPSATNDRLLFARTLRNKDMGSGIEADDALEDSSMEDALREMCAQASYFYLQQQCKIQRPATEPLKQYVQSLINWALEMTGKMESGHHTVANNQWKSDILKMMMAWEENYHDHIDLQLICRGPTISSQGSQGQLQLLKLSWIMI
ncbi:hypothetical protein DL763_010762 [Monosporascus cannonballus]|nr:hypothetical protein DL763_010762 [Monosporascus cannonballus]